LAELSQRSRQKTASADPDAPIRVALILASKLERLGWGIVVDSQPDMQVVGQFASLPPALAFLKKDAVDVALVDEAMLTPKNCESIARALANGRPRLLLLARHPVDPALYPFISRCLLNGVTAAGFVAAIRGAYQFALHG
jgi:hypothetical protein